jgi:hypothetical protein
VQTSFSRLIVMLATSGALALGACASDPDLGSDEMTAQGPIPRDRDALFDWLVGRGYFAWASESAIHDSTGPHFGGVQTYVEPTLFDSLMAGSAAHPEGSATVKELYGSGDTVQGWSVSIKLQDDSAGGDGWYWYEYYDGDVLISDDGASACTGCHGGGTDYVLTPFPLQ